MKKENNLTTGISEPEKVNVFMSQLQHPLLELVQYLRMFIVNIDSRIGEGIYWNVPTFYFTGKMKPFNPKEYKRYLVGFNFYKQDAIRLIFLNGANVADPTGLLEGDYTDGRRITTFKGVEDFKSKEEALKNIVEQLLELMD